MSSANAKGNEHEEDMKMTQFKTQTSGSQSVSGLRTGARTAIRLARLVIGAVAAIGIQAATGLVPGLGSTAFAAGGAPSIQFEPVHCDAYQMNAYTPIITGYDATPGVEDYQYVDYELRLEVKAADGSWQSLYDQPQLNLSAYEPVISGYFVVNDGTGVVKDVTVPGLHGFLIPRAGTYRVVTMVWWTNAGPSASTSNWSGPIVQPGDHYLASATYVPNGQSCNYPADQFGNTDALWTAVPGGPTVWGSRADFDGSQVHAYDPTIVANDSTGSKDYQEVVYALQLQQLNSNGSWQNVGGYSFVSAPIVVNDGTGTTKDVFLPGYHNITLNPNITATYRVQAIVWWTKTQTSPTFSANVNDYTWSTTMKVGSHYQNTGLLYIYTGRQATYTAPVTVTITS
jgi:hypothetical protein